MSNDEKFGTTVLLLFRVVYIVLAVVALTTGREPLLILSVMLGMGLMILWQIIVFFKILERVK
jgi:hypothetical protein